jgi:hypothetical protein
LYKLYNLLDLLNLNPIFGKKTMKKRIAVYSTIFIFGFLLVTGCTKDKNNSLSAFKPEITNTADDFQLQATNVVNTSTSITYTWRNNGVTANIDKSGILSSGSATVTVLDANGLKVYTSDLSTTGSDVSTTGVAGDWKIQLKLTTYNGTLSLRLQKGS